MYIQGVQGRTAKDRIYTKAIANNGKIKKIARRGASELVIVVKYRGADKSLPRPGKIQATMTKPAEMSNTPR
jgi:hypothetical protein